MSGYALETEGLSKSYGALAVTQAVDLRLRGGSRHALIGPNGAGKTTLVGLLSGVIRPDGGRVSLFGEDITHLASAGRTRRGLVRTFQVTNLFPSMTVIENIYLAVAQQRGLAFSLFRPAASHGDVLDRVEQLIERIRLKDQALRRVSELAYGQQRLIEVAIALALEPRVLILDEPAAGIPTSELELLMSVVEELDPNIAILIIEHDMAIVRRFATEVSVLVGGKLMLEGPVCDVLASPELRRVYLGASQDAKPSEKVLLRA